MQAAGVNMVVPSLDETLSGWAERKAHFRPRGIHVILSDLAAIEICRDKRETFRFFKQHGIPTAETSLAAEFPMLKPRCDRGGKGIRMASAGAETRMDGMISQELLSGQAGADGSTMTLGFHYHVPVVAAADGVLAPGHVGVFLDALAERVAALRLYLHEARPAEARQCDYRLRHRNATLVSLGTKTPAWYRFLLPGRTLRKVAADLQQCDAVIVRAPSPLAPDFPKYSGGHGRLCYLLVGDYLDGARHLQQPWWRLWPIKALLRRNDRQLRRVLPHVLTLVNSRALYEKYRGLCPTLHPIKTTTLSQRDFFVRETTCSREDVGLLYTGRLDPAKGLGEIIEAVALLRNERRRLRVDFVAWEDDPNKSVERALTAQAQALGIANQITFHGKRAIGAALNAMYRSADIYLLPSYHEGFPRSIWEAMANSVPVICTPVGGIPFELTDRVHALFVRVKDARDLAAKIKEVVNDDGLRRRLIAAGRDRAGEVTLETQTSRMIATIADARRLAAIATSGSKAALYG